MSTRSQRRLAQQFSSLQSEGLEGVQALSGAENLLRWNAVIAGPPGTPFEDATFKLLLTFDENYPFSPPKARFLSRMFHPNVYPNGDICLDILDKGWSPMQTPATILVSIQSLLNDPNPNEPANPEAAQLYRENMKEYVRRVKITAQESWLAPD